MMKRRFIVFITVFVFLFTASIGIVKAADTTEMKIPNDAVMLDGRSYKVYTTKMTWEQAKDYCQSLGGHLVTITSAEEQDFVSNLVIKTDLACWIGAYASGTTFKWVTDEPFSYTNWDDGEPSRNYNSSDEPYVGIYANNTATSYSTTGKWNDFSANTGTVKGFVCEWEIQCIDSEGEVFHSHDILKAVMILSPSCETSGTRNQICNRCGTVVFTEEVPAIGHMPGSWKITKEPTCLEGGLRQWECQICRKIFKEEALNPTGHIYGPWKDTKDPTCIESGLRQQKCQVCEMVLTEAVLHPTGHIYGPWAISKDPTCAASGLCQQYCQKCKGVIKEETVHPIGHAYSEWEIVSGSALLLPIVKERTCYVCDRTESYNDWGTVWIPILILAAIVGLVVGIVFYIKFGYIKIFGKKIFRRKGF